MSFLEELALRGVIKENQIGQVLKLAEEKYKGDIERSLADFGLTEDRLLDIKSEFYNIPIKKIDPKALSTDALHYIPEDSANHYKFAPLSIEDNVLHVGIVDPTNTQAMDALQFLSAKSNIPFKTFLVSPTVLKAVLDSYKGVSGEVEKAAESIAIDVTASAQPTSLEEAPESPAGKGEEKIVEEAPIIKIVGVILRTAVEGGASDIHIENVGEKVKVRFRVDGILHVSLVLPINVYSGVVARIKILSKLRLDEKRKPQDGSFSAKFQGRKIDFRVSTFPSYFGEKVVMRILDTEKGVKPLDTLGLTPANLSLMREAISKPYGLILITGPTGSGKTTTLYSMLNELDREKYNVVSLEDPVEYNIPGISQSQVQPEIGYTFANGLRSILRQDPDIIMVGEIRDKETAQLAIQAALTGHLVFSTLHTNNAIGAIPRLVDMGVDPYLIAPTLILTVAQRLVRKTCEPSRKEMPVDESIGTLINNQFADLPEEYRKKLPIGKSVYEVQPSPECPGGTKGRIAVYEMFKIDKDIQNIILKNPVEPELYKAARQKGMLTMREDAILKSTVGEIPFQEVYTL
jgi:type IV pilus assembly protein PilB